MFQINLKKLISKKEGLSVIQEVLNAFGGPLGILDTEGKILLGENLQNPINQFPVKLSGNLLGWVVGDQGASSVASLLGYLAQKELEKKALAHELLDKYREITLHYQISHKLSASLDLKEVSQVAIAEAQKLITANNGAVFLVNERTSKLEVVAAFGQVWRTNQAIALGTGIIGNVVQTSKGEIVNDVFADPREISNPENMTSLMCVPLKTKEQAIGAIALGNTDPITYSAEDLKGLTLLASQAASAIENACLHEHQLQETRREALLFRLASLIRESLELTTILETAVSEIRNLLQIDRCLFLWDRREGEIVSESSQPDLGNRISPPPAVEIANFMQRILAAGMLRIDDINTCTDLLVQQFCFTQGFQSILALPIQTRSGKTGVVVCAHCRENRPWSDNEIELLEAVGNQLAIALDQAELYAQTRLAALTAQAQTEQLQKTLRELGNTQAQLIQSEKMSSLGQLVAGVAHEINNPVSFIYGNITPATQYIQDLLTLLQLYQEHTLNTPIVIQEYIQAIDLEFLMEDLPKLLTSMQIGADRIRQIVLSLRNFSRLDQADKKPVDIHEGLESTLLILQNRLKPKPGHPTIEVIKEFGELPLVECYAGQLNQVFMNILSNAIDALEMQDEPGLITIHTQLGLENQFGIPQSCTHKCENSWACQWPFVIIRITDNGPGISEEIKRHLFEPFFTTKPTGKGTGLGLSISYQIVVQKHGGTIECFSQPGQGTEFWIQIPLVPLAGKSVTHNIYHLDGVSPLVTLESRQQPGSSLLPSQERCNQWPKIPVMPNVVV